MTTLVRPDAPPTGVAGHPATPAQPHGAEPVRRLALELGGGPADGAP